jgi:N-acetylglucosamine-6-phosphate deacetylase
MELELDPDCLPDRGKSIHNDKVSVKKGQFQLQDGQLSGCQVSRQSMNSPTRANAAG